MSKKKQKKTSLKSAILLLLLMAILLITSSYAWFTSNTAVTVSTLTVNVGATNGLQISADGTNWKAVLTNTDLQGITYVGSVENTNQISAAMSPVSTTGTVTNGIMDMYHGSVAATDGVYYLEATKETDTQGTAGNYIVFDLYLKVDASSPIELTTDSGVTASGADTGLQNAARIAFVEEGHVSANSTVASIQDLMKTSGSAWIWEPNTDTHTAAGVAAARDTYGISSTTIGGNVNAENGNVTGGTKLAYYGIKDEIADETITAQQLTTPPNSTYFGAVTTTYDSVNGFTDPISFTTLAAGVTKYRVYMWVEGQDVDCENTASGTNIAFNIRFSL